MKKIQLDLRLARVGAVAAFASAVLFGCAGSSTSGGTTPSALLGSEAWTLTFSDSPCVLHGAKAVVTDGGCGEQRQLAMTPAIASSLGAKVQKLTAEREATAGGMVTVLTSGATTTRIDQGQGIAILTELQGYLDAANIAAREARFAGDVAGITCAAGQVVLTIDTCPGVAGTADVCGPATHTCGVPQAAGAACQYNAACSSKHCSAASVCE